MLNLSVEYLAQQEIEKATAWYFDRGEELADRFAREVSEMFKIIVERPTSFPKITKLSRRCLLSTFPYKIVFLEREGQLSVIAFSHASRDPTYWQPRES